MWPNCNKYHHFAILLKKLLSYIERRDLITLGNINNVIS